MTSVDITDVLRWLDGLDADLAAQEDTFGEYLSKDGKIIDLKKEIQKLHKMRQD